jgi:hypothetical protein
MVRGGTVPAQRWPAHGPALEVMMRRTPAWMALTGLWPLLLCGCPPTSSRQDSRATISGRVVLKPLAGANDFSRVRVDIGRGEGGAPVDDGGNFEFSDIEPDVYQLTVTYAGGLNAQATRSAYQRHEQRVVARAGGSVVVGDLALALAQGSVRGEVAVQDGVEPADGTLVELTTESGVVVGREVVRGQAYAFSDVTVGTYRVVVTKAGLAPQAGEGQEPCGVKVVVAQEADEASVDPVVLHPTRPVVTPVEGDVAVRHGATWFLTHGTSSIGFQVEAPYAVDARVWLGEAPSVDGGLPWASLSQQGYALTPVQNNDETALNIQLRDGCGNEFPTTILTIVRDEEPPDLTLLLGGLSSGGPGRPPTRQTSAHLEVVTHDRSPLSGLHVGVVRGEVVDGRYCQDLEENRWGAYVPSQVIALDASPDRADDDGPRVVVACVRDLLDNVAQASTVVTLDRSRPDAPKLEPQHDPSALALLAPDVEVLVQLPVSRDPWDVTAYLEVDRGAGFSPLCLEGDPAQVWDPCGRECNDPALLCEWSAAWDGAAWVGVSTFRGVRVPLAAGTSTRIAVRAVDLAGNVGDGAVLVVSAPASAPVLVEESGQAYPRVLNGYLVYTDDRGHTGVVETVAGDNVGVPTRVDEFLGRTRHHSTSGMGVEAMAALRPTLDRDSSQHGGAAPTLITAGYSRERDDAGCHLTPRVRAWSLTGRDGGHGPWSPTETLASGTTVRTTWDCDTSDTPPWVENQLEDSFLSVAASASVEAWVSYRRVPADGGGQGYTLTRTLHARPVGGLPDAGGAHASVSLQTVSWTPGCVRAPVMTRLQVGGDVVAVAEDFALSPGQACGITSPQVPDLARWSIYRLVDGTLHKVGSEVAEYLSLSADGHELATAANGFLGSPDAGPWQVSLSHRRAPPGAHLYAAADAGCPSPDGGPGCVTTLRGADHGFVTELALDQRRVVTVQARTAGDAGMDLSGAFRLVLEDRQPGADGVFFTEDDTRRDYPRGQNFSKGLVVTGGVAYIGVEGAGLDILAIPLSTTRWDVLDPSGVGDYVVDDVDGTVIAFPMFVPGMTVPMAIRARHTDGIESTGVRPMFFPGGGNRTAALSGGWLYTLEEQDGGYGLLALGAGDDRRWFTGDDDSPGRLRLDPPPPAQGVCNWRSSNFTVSQGFLAITCPEAAGTHRVQVFGPGGGAWGTALTAQEQMDGPATLAVAGAPGVLLAHRAEVAVNGGDRWGVVLLRYAAGPDAWDDSAASPPRPVACPGSRFDTDRWCTRGHTGSPVLVAHSTPRASAEDGLFRVWTSDGRDLLMLETAEPSVLNAEPAWSSGSFRWRVLPLPMPLSHSDVAGPVRGRLAFTVAIPRVGTEVVSLDMETQRLTLHTTHYSAKHNVTLDPRGNIRWLDSILDLQGVFAASP